MSKPEFDENNQSLPVSQSHVFCTMKFNSLSAASALTCRRQSIGPFGVSERQRGCKCLNLSPPTPKVI